MSRKMVLFDVLCGVIAFHPRSYVRVGACSPVYYWKWAVVIETHQLIVNKSVRARL